MINHVSLEVSNLSKLTIFQNERVQFLGPLAMKLEFRVSKHLKWQFCKLLHLSWLISRKSKCQKTSNWKPFKFQTCYIVQKSPMCRFQLWPIYWLKEPKIKIGSWSSKPWWPYITWCVMEMNVSFNIWLQVTPTSNWAIFSTKVVRKVRKVHVFLDHVQWFLVKLNKNRKL